MGENRDVSATYNVTAGPHDVVVTNALGERYQTSVDIPADELRTVNVIWRIE
jgi:hypothetical protein